MGKQAVQRAFNRAVKAVSVTSSRKIQTLHLADTSIILSALPDISALTDVRRRLATSLQKRLSVAWIETGDMYEVFAVLSALWQYNQATVTGDYLASAVQRLIFAELQVGGPYYSVDAPAANVQIAIFMRLVAKPLPGLSAYLADIIAEVRFEDTRLDRLWLLYLLAKTDVSKQLRIYSADYWRQVSRPTQRHAVVALAVFQTDPAYITLTKEALATLLLRQRKDGLWAAEPRGKADLLTTAAAIGVLACLLPVPPDSSRAALQKKQRLVTTQARQAFSGHAEPLRTVALEMVDKIADADKNFEMTLLSRLFAGSLKHPAVLTAKQHTMLGLASLCGWIAYTIYDDFLDDEGQPAKLPVANVAMRMSLAYFKTALPNHAHFHQYVEKIFTRMDEANAWEVSHCRFTLSSGQITITQLPRYGTRQVLARRSFAHALTGIAVLVQDAAVTARQIHSVKTAFTHYLIARQLSDDLHDWVKDLHVGQASYVVTTVLCDARVQPGTYELSALLPKLKRQFRRTTMVRLCQLIIRHIHISKGAFERSNLLQADNNVYDLLDHLELSTRRSLDMHAKAQALVDVQKRNGNG